MRQFNITGMSCAACSSRVEKSVSKLDGIDYCAVNLLTNSMMVDGTASDAQIIKAVEDAGYGASPKKKSMNGKENFQDESVLKDEESPKILKRLIASAIFMLLLMYVAMGHMMWSWPLPYFLSSNHLAIGLVELLLTIPVMVINQKFFISGFKALIKRAPNMDTLVALGSSAAFLYSLYALFALSSATVKGDSSAQMKYMHEFYFESAAMILTLITIGKYLEAKSKGKTTDALKKLMELAPKSATIIKDGKECKVSIDDVSIGDIFVVKPGESIPVDGIVLEGESAIDESSLTGESIPVDKTVNDKVSAATINQSGFLKCKATRVGENTTLSQIIQMVSDASATKAPIAKVADKVSGIFVPSVILIATLTTIGWLIAGKEFSFALARGISVLVISCPCALGLATPVAIMVGSGIGAKNGILFKNAESLEQTGKVDIVVLDKTGTITEGKPSVTGVYANDGIEKDELLRLAGSVEKKSEHPLSKAVTSYLDKLNIKTVEVDSFKALSGNGVEAKLDGKQLVGGSYKYIKGITEISEKMEDLYKTLSSNGQTLLFFAYDGKLLGAISVADTLKPDSKKAISELKNMGIDVVMLTGDNEITANAIAMKVGIDKAIANVLPGGKEQEIKTLEEKGKVMMVGDGINDAPALTRANIGVAIKSGTDIAMDAADIVLMNSKLSDVPAAIRLSRQVLKNIHENLFWAFGYNIIGIPLAMGLFIHLLGWNLNPMFGAAMMSISSFLVVTNALRLNLFDIKSTKHDKKKTKHMKNKEDKKMIKTLKIDGMMCSHCEMTVKKALESIDGVESAKADHEKGEAFVELSKPVDDKTLKEAVEAKDYKVISIK